MFATQHVTRTNGSGSRRKPRPPIESATSDVAVYSNGSFCRSRIEKAIVALRRMLELEDKQTVYPSFLVSDSANREFDNATEVVYYTRQPYD